MHIPVLLDRCLELLGPAVSEPNAVMVDATFGLGGHSAAFLSTFPDLTLVGVDRDPIALAKAAARLAEFGERFVPRAGSTNTSHRSSRPSTVAGSTRFSLISVYRGMQLDEPQRGFSYSRDAPLDMRMNQEDELTAREIVNTHSEADLVGILRDYGEERNARRIARAIIRQRTVAPIESTSELADLVQDALPQAAKRTGGNRQSALFRRCGSKLTARFKGFRRPSTQRWRRLSWAGESPSFRITHSKTAS